MWVKNTRRSHSEKARIIIAFASYLLGCVPILFILYTVGFMDTPIRILKAVLFSLLFPSVICFFAGMAGKLAKNKTF